MFASAYQSLLEEFERSAAAKLLRKIEDFEDFQQRADDRQRQEKRERKEREEFEAAFATPAQLAAFRDKLDRYDTAVVAALMDNEAARTENTARLNEMLSHAYVLPDGRRVFRSEDGQHVIDEYGGAVSADVVHPDVIPVGGPSGEAYLAERARQERLNHEQVELLRYQRRVDDARTAIERPGLTGQELNGLDADLRDAMPDAIRHQLTENSPDHNFHKGDAPLASHAIQARVLVP